MEYICITGDVTFECNLQDAEGSLGKKMAWNLDGVGTITESKHDRASQGKSLEKLVEAK